MRCCGRCALDPQLEDAHPRDSIRTRVSDDDVRTVLAKGPTPRIMLMHGGIYPVHLVMESFGTSWPAWAIRKARSAIPATARWSHSPYEDASACAGILAWYYEQDGMPPMMIGHSQGGMQAVKVLHVLDGDVRRRASGVEPDDRFPPRTRVTSSTR